MPDQKIVLELQDWDAVVLNIARVSSHHPWFSSKTACALYTSLD